MRRPRQAGASRFPNIGVFPRPCRDLSHSLLCYRVRLVIVLDGLIMVFPALIKFAEAIPYTPLGQQILGVSGVFFQFLPQIAYV